jgi:hypothetical protein
MTEPIDRAWVRDHLITYGHSFLAETGLTNPANYYARRIATQFGMQYPTNAAGGVNKRAVGGSYAEAAADVMLTGQPWIPDKRHGSNKTLLIQALINTARRHGVNPITRQGAEHALRTMCALGSSLETIPEYAAFFTYSDGWAHHNSGEFHGGRYAVANASAAPRYVEFTVPSDGCHFLTVARKHGLAGSVIEFQRLDTGQTFLTWDNVDQAQADIARSYVPAAIPLRVPAGTRVRVRLVSGVNLVCDGLIVPAARPGPILLMKEPYLEDYTASTAFPLGSDEALDFFNEILDELASEFPNAIVADPNEGGHWDKTTHLLPDGVHPNAAGHAALAATMLDAIRAQLVAKSYAAGLAL